MLQIERKRKQKKKEKIKCCLVAILAFKDGKNGFFVSIRKRRRKKHSQMIVRSFVSPSSNSIRMVTIKISIPIAMPY